MSDNEALKRQIESLEAAIKQQRQALSAPRYSTYNGARAAHPYYHRPIRPRGAYAMRPPARPSRNMTLVVKREAPSAAAEGAATPTEEKTTKYISCANKLVKVDESGANSTSFRPTIPTNYRPKPVRPRPARHFTASKPGPVTIDGETYISEGRGNKLVRASSIRSTSSSATASAFRRGVVNIEGENFVRTKKGSLVRVSALRNYSSQRASAAKKTTRGKRPLCTKFVYGRCDKSAEDCLYSHRLTPETVPICLHFQTNKCVKDEQSCMFVHVKVSPDAPICRDFVYKHFCAKGRKCLHRHVWECPDWVEKNNCSRPKCKLPHPPKTKAKLAAVPAVSKDEEERFIKQFIQRPVFDGSAVYDAPGFANTVFGDAGNNCDSNCLDSEARLLDDEYTDDSSDNDEEDLSCDEAEELLKWYDDNYAK